jgi:hypothetical protein
MEDIIDLIATNASPAEVSDAIKNALYTKASERVDAAKPLVSSLMFNEDDLESENEYDETEGGEEDNDGEEEYYEDGE